MFDSCCKETNYKMSKTQNVILRLTIVLAMIVAVVAVLYFSPLPEGHFESCDRPCHDLDWPMICRIKLHVEAAQTIRTCEGCASNNQSSSQEILLNRQSPGPSIQICQNDILVVDIVNKIPGHTLTVHWRGQPNNEAPYMDGVPLVTQCPILSYTTFQYKFRVTAPGTHVYHAYSDDDRSRGIFGALIVRQPEKIEPLRKHYDVDSKSHLILISESDNQLLINGKGSSDTGALSIFNVRSNKRYRFRVAFIGGDSGCPVTVSIDNHPIRIIALDGNPVNPTEVNSLILGKGERVDFVVKTKLGSGGYFVRVKSCKGKGLALLNYEDTESKTDVNNVPEEEGRSFDTVFCESKIGRVCLKDVKSSQRMPELLREITKVVYLSFGSRIVNVNGKFSSRIYGVNNLTFTYPSSPLLTQLDKISLGTVCDRLNIPETCRGKEICECVHVEYIPSGSSTEIILINQDENEEHIFHLHGYRFYLVGFRQFDTLPSSEEIKLLDRQNVLFKRNLNNPILKDTIRVPKNGVVALRFLANNPGFWMLRDEKSKGWTRGMDIVFQVGDSSDLASTPSDFPTCGNYIGPDFFLM